MGSGRIMGFIDDIAPSPADRFGSKLENGEVLLVMLQTKPLFSFTKLNLNRKLA